MKKPILACLALSCLAPLSNAVVYYNTMDPVGSFPFDEFLSPPSSNVPGTNQYAVDDVTFSANVKVTSVSFRFLSNNNLSVGDTLNGYLYIYGSDGLGNLDPSNQVFGPSNGLLSLSVTAVGSGLFIFDYTADVNDLTNINLSATKYWFGMQIVSTNPNVQPFFAAAGNYGQGYNVKLYNGSSWQNWTGPRGYQGPVEVDLSMKIEGQELGEPAVPGPAAILPFGLGLAAALRRRRK